LATLLILALIEGASSLAIAANVWIRQPVQSMAAERVHLEYDEQLGWKHKPDLALTDLYGPGKNLHTNSQRLRAKRDYTAEVPAGRVRIVCSGDSFTLGHSVDDADAWCNRLQELEPRVESVNMGQAAYGVDQAYLWFRRDAEWMAHDIQLFGFIYTDFERMQSDNFLGYPKPLLRVVNGKLELDNVPVPRTMDDVVGSTRRREAIGLLRVVALARAIGRRLGIDSPSRASVALSNADVESSAALIFEELKRINEAKGSQLVLLFLPRSGDESFQWSDSWRAFVSREAQRLGIPVIDLVPEFRKLRVDEIKGLFVDPFRPSHYNEAGNDWVASQVLQRLNELRLLEKGTSGSRARK
jgi:hypothetical protein